MKNDFILKIISAGGMAPSGDNMQPWKTTWDGETLRLYLEKKADISVYNTDECGSYIACGAFIENVRLMAASLGYTANISFFPNATTDPFYIANIIFIKNTPAELETASFINKRHSNRKKYLKKEISSELISIFNLIDPSIKIITDKFLRNTIFDIASLNEYFILHNDHVRNGLMKTIRWSSNEEEISRTGLFFKTLELNLGQLFFFRKFTKPLFVKILNFLGFPKILQKSGKNLYSTSSAVGAVTIKSMSPQDLVSAGIIIEKIWIIATKKGLAFQPITGIPYLIFAMNKNSKIFSINEQRLLKDADFSLRKIFELSPSDQFGMIFRLGYANKVSAISKRKPVHSFHEFINNL